MNGVEPDGCSMLCTGPFLVSLAHWVNACHHRGRNAKSTYHDCCSSVLLAVDLVCVCEDAPVAVGSGVADVLMRVTRPVADSDPKAPVLVACVGQ
jgi:hypothetical protein